MRQALVGLALVISLWPVGAIVWGVSAIVGRDGESDRPTAVAPTPEPGDGGLAQKPPRLDTRELAALRRRTASLVAALGESAAVTGRRDDELAGEARALRDDLIRWRSANPGEAQATQFALLFEEIAASTQAFATEPSDATRARLDAAIRRHRAATGPGGA